MRKCWDELGFQGSLKAITSTIGVKQECPLSHTLFKLYMNEVANNTHGGSKRIDILDTPVHILRYVLGL